MKYFDQDKFSSTLIVWNFSWTQIWDTDLRSEIVSTKRNFDPSNQRLIDYLNRYTLNTYQVLSEELSFKLLCNIFFPLLSCQSNISCFTMANLQ